MKDNVSSASVLTVDLDSMPLSVLWDFNRGILKFEDACLLYPGTVTEEEEKDSK